MYIKLCWLRQPCIAHPSILHFLPVELLMDVELLLVADLHRKAMPSWNCHIVSRLSCMARMHVVLNQSHAICRMQATADCTANRIQAGMHETKAHSRKPAAACACVCGNAAHHMTQYELHWVHM